MKPNTNTSKLHPCCAGWERGGHWGGSLLSSRRVSQFILEVPGSLRGHKQGGGWLCGTPTGSLSCPPWLSQGDRCVLAHLAAPQPSVAPEGWHIALTSLHLGPSWASHPHPEPRGGGISSLGTLLVLLTAFGCFPTPILALLW